MTYRTLMVHLDAGRSNAGVLDVAAALAQRYEAKVIGIAACEPVQIGYVEGDYTGALAVAEREIVDDELKVVALEFGACTGLSRHVLEWRGLATMDPVAHIVAHEARCADLLITGVATGGLDTTLHADTGDHIIRAGRPVLVVPPVPVAMDFTTVMVAWSDTRECRRAIVDALPLLHDADRVIIAGVGPEASCVRPSIRDVTAWLHRHQIGADVIVAHAEGGKGRELAAIADEHDVDLIVAGAYGHNRLAEWAFGGVTRTLLLEGRRCALLSH